MAPDDCKHLLNHISMQSWLHGCRTALLVLILGTSLLNYSLAETLIAQPASPRLPANLPRSPGISRLLALPVMDLEGIQEQARAYEAKQKLHFREMRLALAPRYCGMDLADRDQYLADLRKILRARQQAFQLAQARYEKKIARYLQKHKLELLLDRRVMVTQLQSERQRLHHSLIMEILDQLADLDQENCQPTELPELEIPDNLLTSAIYLARYRFWQKVPAVHRAQFFQNSANPPPDR